MGIAQVRVGGSGFLRRQEVKINSRAELQDAGPGGKAVDYEPGQTNLLLLKDGTPVDPIRRAATIQPQRKVSYANTA
jgi:hypothetical protein